MHRLFFAQTIKYCCGRTIKGKPIDCSAMSGNNDRYPEKASQMCNSTVSADKNFGGLYESCEFMCGTSYRRDDSFLSLNSIFDLFNPLSFRSTARQNQLHIGIPLKYVLDYFSRRSNAKRSFGSGSTWVKHHILFWRETIFPN